MSATRGALVVSPRLRAKLAGWAAQALPREGCGLLLGTRDAQGARVRAVTRAANLALGEDAWDLDPGALVRAEARGPARGLAILGAWHSHRGKSARPSLRDRAAAWKGWSYLIVADPGGAASFRAWRRAGDELVEESLCDGRDEGASSR